VLKTIRCIKVSRVIGAIRVTVIMRVVKIIRVTRPQCTQKHPNALQDLNPQHSAKLRYRDALLGWLLGGGGVIRGITVLGEY